MLRIAAYLLIGGFVCVLVASVVGPSAVYTAPDAQTRLEIIDARQGSWRLSNIFFGLAGVLTAAGALALWMQTDSQTGRIAGTFGSFALVGGMLAWCVYTAQRMLDPAAFLYVVPWPLMALAFAILTPIGLIGLGWAWLQTAWPAWVGYVMLIGNALIAVGAVIFPAQFYAGFPPQVFFLFTLAAGVVLLRQ